MFKKYFSLDKSSEFKKRESVMEKSEEVFYLELLKQLPDGFYVFPKMRVADIIETTSGRGYYSHRNEILPKHIDFLICNSFFHPILAIELNGSSHMRNDRKDSDKEKKEIFEFIELPLEFVNVGTNFDYDISGLINKYLV